MTKKFTGEGFSQEPIEGIEGAQMRELLHVVRTEFLTPKELIEKLDSKELANRVDPDIMADKMKLGWLVNITKGAKSFAVIVGGGVAFGVAISQIMEFLK